MGRDSALGMPIFPQAVGFRTNCVLKPRVLRMIYKTHIAALAGEMFQLPTWLIPIMFCISVYESKLYSTAELRLMLVSFKRQKLCAILSKEGRKLVARPFRSCQVNARQPMR